MTPTARSIALLVPLAMAVSACSGETKKDSSPSVLPGTPALAAAQRAPSRAAMETGSFRDISVAEASALIEGDAPVVVLDVRTPQEFAEGHIEGAINVDALSETFIEDLAKLDKSASYVLHCRSGRRSAKALEHLREANFKDIAHMTAGLNGWREAGLATAP